MNEHYRYALACAAEDVPMPVVVRGCKVCQPSDEEILSGYVVVSPIGIAHHGEDDGDTSCGKDATEWWWPL